jgi:NAD(P)-dependent dehydrogenase (short-subunit alcohol dehydrogenase family)
MDKLCIITGGSRGIGKGIVFAFASKGYKVAFTYNKNAEMAKQIEKELNVDNYLVKSFQMKIEDRKSVRNTFEKIKNHFNSKASILVNNAAIAQEKPFHTITDLDWEIMQRINLQGPFICTQEILNDFLANCWGRIINITSIGGQWGGFNQVHYAASKAGLINFTQSIAKIYSKNNITSNAIAIGLVGTAMSKKELQTEEGKKKVENIPLGRIGTVEDIANAALFLCSKKAEYITGQTINLNGGMFFG